MTTNLTKRDLVLQISEDTNMSQKEVLVIVQKTLDYIREALAQGKNVELRNFGVFEIRVTKPRVGRNPKKPKKNVTIPARATVKFKTGKQMREQVLQLTHTLGNGLPAESTVESLSI